MNGLIITPTKKEDIKLFVDLARRMGVKVRTVSDEDLLDFGLLKAMEEGRKTSFVSRDRILKTLQRNGNQVQDSI